jgi:hypothetical protein
LVQIVTIGWQGDRFGDSFTAAHRGETKVRTARVERHHDA